MKTTHAVTVGEYDDERIVAVFDDKKTAEEFAEFIGGTVYEVPVNPKQSTWEVWEATIYGDIREGKFVPRHTASRKADDPFWQKKDGGKTYSTKWKSWTFLARAKTKKEAEAKCKDAMILATGFDGDMEKQIKEETDRAERERAIGLENFRSIYGDVRVATIHIP